MLGSTLGTHAVQRERWEHPAVLIRSRTLRMGRIVRLEFPIGHPESRRVHAGQSWDIRSRLRSRCGAPMFEIRGRVPALPA